MWETIGGVAALLAILTCLAKLIQWVLKRRKKKTLLKVNIDPKGTRTVACPQCNNQMRMNLPDPPSPWTLSYIFGSSESSNYCPTCRVEVFISVGRNGEIKEIYIDE